MCKQLENPDSTEILKMVDYLHRVMQRRVSRLEREVAELLEKLDAKSTEDQKDHFPFTPKDWPT